ncbi:MAG: hypothetical protein H7145_17070 [Akkermansiaceae bacterium]|nr:hypothetical protein [Armatimonadota bacterium]
MPTNPFEKYLQNDLADFAGLRVSGTLPVKQEILNDLLQSVLADMQSPVPTPTPASVDKAASSASGFDPKSLVRFVKRAEIRAEEGRLVLDFDVNVDAPGT